MQTNFLHDDEKKQFLLSLPDVLFVQEPLLKQK